METVVVLLSAYNGENFIEEQVESILAQSGVNVRLYIRDDGSTDKTRDILERLLQKHPAICLDYGQNIGAAQAFMQLLYNAEKADFYAFADQDDVWLNGKLSAAVTALKGSGKMLYAGNQQIVDEKLNPISFRYDESYVVNASAEAILQNNLYSGCTMVMTASLRTILVKEENRPSRYLLERRYHDVWVAAVAAMHGGIYYDTKPYILYRQHGKNAVGADKISGFRLFGYWFKKLGKSKGKNGRSALSRELVARFPQAKDYPLISVSAERGIKGKRRLIKNSAQIRAYSGESRLSLILKILFGLY